MPQPTIPLPASTVVLVRPNDTGGFEIFMNRRPAKMDTYGGIHVFPGGRVEQADCSAAMLELTQGLTPAEAQRKLGGELEPERCLGHWVAAARELFEEAGIYLFAPQNGAPSDSARQNLPERLAERRAVLQRGDINLAALLASERLYCDLGRLDYFFHRVTPEHYPVRFDTRFYLAALPPEQTPLQSSEEVSESLWISPTDALERSQLGDFPMMPPTIAVLRSLSIHGSWNALGKVFPLGCEAAASATAK
jgi:8-oxo-dGTP pyrophosphatase MutT (NUDIX family)